MKKRIFLILILILLSLFSIYPAMADVYTSEKETKIEKDDPYYTDTSIGAILGESAEKATVENLEKYIDDKGSTIIGLMQYGSKPALIIAFIFAAFLTLCGVFGDGSLVLKGIIGMVVCGIVYSVVTFAPEALGYISGFFAP